MPPAPGRPAREPMERLVRLATVLHHHPEFGVSAEELFRVAGFDGGADPGTQLNREFKHLRALGWQIENVAGQGESARYRMTTVDNRLRLRLTPEQQSALRRAVILADREDLVQRLGLPAESATEELVAAVPRAADQALQVVTRALRLRCLLSYRYNGSQRLVHPQSLRSQNRTWYLRGVEDGSDVVKAFVVSRMSEVDAADPGSAAPVERSHHQGLHPMSWEIDPPVEVSLRTPTEFAADVRRWLGTPTVERLDGAFAILDYRVTNRAALRRRIVELGTRVEVLGPEEIRQELIAELAEMAGE